MAFPGHGHRMADSSLKGFAEALRDRYLIERELGAGGMAKVYLAHDLRHDRKVALKVLRPELAVSLGPERFQREIKLAARFQHPHILGVFDSGDAAGRLWFTMPYVEGESLRDRLRREGQLAVDDALRITREVADGLDFAHRHGVVHRDVKPENILVSDGHSLVADFGISRALAANEGDEALTETGVSVGTPAYMSPEQATGQQVDARTDVYALGAVLYEMLAGEPPFTGPTPQAVIAKRFHTDAVPLRAVRPAVPEHVERAVARALARVPADRFASTAELARALEADATAAARATVPRGRGHRASKGVLLLALGVLLGLGVLFGLNRGRGAVTDEGDGLRRVAVLPFDNLAAADKLYFAEGVTDEIRGKLATVPGLQVTARTSSAQYARSTKRPEEIGRELGVAYLLSGTVRWAQEGGQSRVRVSPELVETATGATRWQQSFDAPLIDVFRVQADVAERVARELGVALRAADRRHLETRSTRDLAAYDLYLRGRYAWHQRTAAGLDQARRLLEQAIAADPTFAPAHAALADVFAVLPLWSDLPPDQTYPRARAAALEALRLDSTLASPYAVLGDYYAMYAWDWANAERNFRRSLALDPNNANTHHWYHGDYLLAMGRWDEAISEARRARELDPLSLTINGAAARSLYTAGRTEESVAELRNIVAIDTAFPLTNEYLGTIYVALGRYDEAVPLLRRAVEPTVRLSAPLAILGYALAKSGRRGEAERILEELLERQRRGYIAPTSLAVLHAGLGDTSETFAWLRRALEAHDPFLIYNYVNDPVMAPFRRDPRGQDILQAMGLGGRGR
jgi:TolB-like protein/Tfp pilus assembly protein PilF/tRNA A-37 threonylcarbamoyl transferase component Bud32